MVDRKSGTQSLIVEGSVLISYIPSVERREIQLRSESARTCRCIDKYVRALKNCARNKQSTLYFLPYKMAYSRKRSRTSSTKLSGG